MSGAPEVEATEEDVVLEQVELGVARFIDNILAPHWDEEKKAWRTDTSAMKEHGGVPTLDFFRERFGKMAHALAAEMKAAPQLEQRWIKEAQAKKARIDGVR